MVVAVAPRARLNTLDLTSERYRFCVQLQQDCSGAVLDDGRVVLRSPFQVRRAGPYRAEGTELVPKPDDRGQWPDVQRIAQGNFETEPNSDSSKLSSSGSRTAHH